MWCEVMSRLEAMQASREDTAPTTAVISVTDCGTELNRFYPSEWLVGVRALQFDDVVSGENCMTSEDAKDIADFVLDMRKKVDRFIVHCEFGQSRSAGIAAAINQHCTGSDAGIFRNKRYNPNQVCYRLTLEALKKRSRVPGFLRP